MTALASATSKNPKTLAGLKVLFVPKNSRTPYFQSFLRTGKKTHGWNVHIVAPARHAAVWQGACDKLFETHDFALAASWEADQAVLDDLDAFISSCERTSGISASRMILAGERDLGRGFSLANFHWFHDEIARRVLADNTEPMRIVRRIFAFARQTLQAAQPDILVSGEWANPVCFGFYLAARQMGIPCVVNRLSKLWSGRCYWSAGAQMYNRAAFAEFEKRKTSSAKVSERAQNRIAEFRNKPATLGYVRQNWDALDRRGWIREHIDLARMLGVGILYRLRGRKGPPPKPALRLFWDLYRRTFLQFRQRSLFRRFSEEELRKKKYFLFAMHKDPEQALNYQAPFWSNQYNTISMISSVLPQGYTLLVREHRSNRGRRSTRYYKDVLRLPAVVLIGGLDDQFKYLRNANLIITENGTSGWEGLMLQNRVITLDRTVYSAAGLAREVSEQEKLASVVVDALEQSPVSDSAAHDRALGWMLDAEWQTTVAIDDTGFVETFDLLGHVIAASRRSSTELVSAAI